MLLANRFELGSWIGAGALSVVHEALDRVTGRQVAIKLAVGREESEAVRNRFGREAAALSVISSAHVVELISAGATEDGRPFLVLERLSGKNLQEVVKDRGPIKPSRVARFVQQAATALELAHGVGIVHRDLKPANLFLHVNPDNSTIVKVLDFGMVVDTGGPTERMRDAFGGTPLYMAPEQVRGQLSRIGPATDIWAIAHVTLSLLTGESYWHASQADDVMREIEESTLEKPSARWAWLPELFDKWFLRSTKRVPEQRYKSVSEQALDLAAALRNVQAPDANTSQRILVSASTLAVARTPTPSMIRLSGQRLPVVGRSHDYQEIEQSLKPGTLVTVTGPAGIGKTRIAQAVCEAAADRFIDGAWFASLVPGEGEGPVLSAIATALGIAPDATRGLFEHTVTNLAPRRALIVIDGAERVPRSGEVLERLRKSCPAVAWLATSRLPLGIAGERAHALAPLDVPRDDVSSGEAETYSAVEMFVRYARESVPFSLDDGHVENVIAICRAVEGFPLGIELAAAQLNSSTLAQIRSALEDGRAAGSRVRHAVAWSYGRLAPDQQRMLRQLAVIPAGLTFDQVKKRLAHLSDDPMYAVLRLVQTHLAMWSSDTPRRLLMLDTVRELCRDVSATLGEAIALWNVAREHAFAIASNAASATTDAWLALVDAEHDNLRAVLADLLERSPIDAMELAGHLAYYWYLRGDYLEGAHYLELAIERSGEDAIATALHGAGRLALLTCRYMQAEEMLVRAHVWARMNGDLRAEGNAQQLLGSLSRELGDYPRAKAFHQKSLEIWLSLGDAKEAARTHNYLAFVAWLGDERGIGERRTILAEDDIRALGDPEITIWLLLNRGAVLHHANDPAARDVLGRAFAESIAAQFHEGIAWSLELIGKSSFARGEHLQARAQLAAALRVHRRLGDRWRCASALEALAAVAVESDRPARGAVYLGAADAIRRQIEVPIPACERAMVAAMERRGLELIGDAWTAGRERGRRAPLDQTIELARDVV